MLANMNRRIVLAARPVGEPKETDFRLEEVPMPDPGPREVLIRIIYLSLDPYMRGRLREVKSYAATQRVGDVMVGGAVGEVVRSNHPDFAPGDIVEDSLGWQEYAIGGGPNLRKVDVTLAPISTANGILGMPGMTAYFGLLTSAARRRARRWWSPPRRVPSVRWWDNSPGSQAAAPSALPAVRRSAAS